MPRPAATSALSRLRILDLTRVRAGPTCVRQFADFGADVIKIESPPGVDPNEGMGGPRHRPAMQNLHRNQRAITLHPKPPRPRRGPDMQSLRRNKRAMTLNLRLPEAREVFARLAKSADVVVENYRPDVKF